ERLGFRPFRELLRDWLVVTDQEPELRIRVRLQSRLRTLFADDQDGVGRAALLGNLLGLRPDAEATRYLDSLAPPERRAAPFQAVIGLLQRLAADGPVVVAFDDLHWADGDSIALVTELLDLTQSAAVLVVIAQRLEREHPSWEVHDRAQRHYAHRTTEI